jgi:hypothetical protein
MAMEILDCQVSRKIAKTAGISPENEKSSKKMSKSI